MAARYRDRVCTCAERHKPRLVSISPGRRPKIQRGLSWESEAAPSRDQFFPLAAQREPSERLQLLESAWKQITPRLTGRSSIRCTASNGLKFNYVKSELRLKGGNKQGALMFYSSRTPPNTSCIKQQWQPASTPTQSGASSLLLPPPLP